jgi:hypothetical protein
MTFLFLKLEHNIGKTFNGHLILYLGFPVLAYLMVLAIDAFEIAVTEKDIPCTSWTGEHWFFSEMRSV